MRHPNRYRSDANSSRRGEGRASSIAVRMRVLTVSHYFESHRGGVELVAGSLARELAQRGCGMTWAATDATSSPSESELNAVPLHASNIVETKLGIPFPIISISAIKRISDEVRMADVVLVHDILYMTSLVTFFTAMLYGRPIMVVQHIGLVPYRSFFVRYLMRIANAILAPFMLSRASQVVFISHTTANYFRYISFRSHPRIIFNGVNSTCFRPPYNIDEARQSRIDLFIPVDRPVALFVGRFVEKKGVDILRAVAAQLPDVVFVFAGWGKIDPSSWGFSNVKVLKGLSGHSLAKLYRASDFLVVPSRGEGFPLVVQEALASGMPVICGEETVTADPEAARFLQGVNLAGGHDRCVSEVVTQISKILNSDRSDSEDRSEFSRNRYSWAAAAATYVKVLESLVGESGLAEDGASPRIEVPLPRHAVDVTS